MRGEPLCSSVTLFRDGRGESRKSIMSLPAEERRKGSGRRVSTTSPWKLDDDDDACAAGAAEDSCNDWCAEKLRFGTGFFAGFGAAGCLPAAVDAAEAGGMMGWREGGPLSENGAGGADA